MVLYDKSKLERLKIKFEGVESIDTNYSQSYQDMFVLSMLNGKREGTFIEIGAFNPTFISNTYLLEKKFGWNGVSIDIDHGCKPAFESMRSSRFVLQDALLINYEELFIEHCMPTQIDYLQLDIEPTLNTFNCLKNLPLDKYRFSVITYETDYYDIHTPDDVKEMVRRESREILKSYGYQLVVGDVESNIGFPYEDWYVDPTVVDINLANALMGEHVSLLPDNFMLK